MSPRLLRPCRLGNYTAIVRGVNNTTGVALVDAHEAGTTYTWTGAVDSNWSNPANWTPNAIPQSGDTAVISSGTLNSPTISTGNTTDVQIELGTFGRRLSYFGRRVS